MRRAVIFVSLAVLIVGCNGTTSTSPVASGESEYARAYRNLRWGSAATVTFPSACAMTAGTTGIPPFHNRNYLAPVSSQYPQQVTETRVTKMPLALQPYLPANISSSTLTINICPKRAAKPTTTNLGPIGFMISGEYLFNPYEATGTVPATADNVSYTYQSKGQTQTAWFLDQCNSHPTPVDQHYMWHYHAVPVCLAQQVDGNGPSTILGIALDGFPVYGGRDLHGDVIPVSSLDACNGVTSPTPEFPNGAYHYVLPIGVTNKRSSLNCYTGTPVQLPPPPG